jgi:hypothetical protein
MLRCVISKLTEVSVVFTASVIRAMSFLNIPEDGYLHFAAVKT